MIPLMRANWVIALRGHHDHRHRRYGRCSVFHAAVPGRWQDPARITRTSVSAIATGWS